MPLLKLRALTGEMTSVALSIVAAVTDWQQQTEWWHCKLQRAAGMVRQQSGNCEQQRSERPLVLCLSLGYVR